MSNSVKISLLLFIFLFMTTCAINQLRNIASDPSFKPKWDLNADIPVFDLTISLNNLGGFNNIHIGPFLSPGFNLFPIIGNTWPASNNLNVPGFPIPLDPNSTAIDFDNDGGNDLIIKGFYSKDSSLILTIWFVDNDTSGIILIDPNQITINPISIETVPYKFSYNYTDPTNKLVYKSTNFLDPNFGYYLDLHGDSNIDVGAFSVTLNNNPAVPTYTNATGYTAYFKLDFNLGSTYGIVGQINPLPANNLAGKVTNPPIATAAIIMPDTTVDLGSTIQSVGITNINNLKFNYIFDSTVANDFIADFTFTADQNPFPNIFQPAISAGNLSLDSLNNFSYVSSSKQTIVPLNITSLPTLNNLKMTLNILLPNSPGNIRISPNDSIRVRLNVSGQVTVGSN